MKENKKTNAKMYNAKNLIISSSFINDITRKSNVTDNNYDFNKEKNDNKINLNESESKNNLTENHSQMIIKQTTLKSKHSYSNSKNNSDLNISDDDPDLFFFDEKYPHSYIGHEAFKKYSHIHNNSYSNKPNTSSSKQITIDRYPYQLNQLKSTLNPNSRLNNQIQKNTTSSITPKGEFLNHKYHHYISKTTTQHNNNHHHNKRSLSLYDQGMALKKKRDIIYSKKNKTIEEEYKDYSFKPQINADYTMIINRRTDIDFYTKNMKWKKNVEKKKQRLINEMEQDELIGHPFKPKINKRIIPDDITFIDKNVKQISTYANRQQKHLEQQDKSHNIKHNNSSYMMSDNTRNLSKKNIGLSKAKSASTL